MGACDAGVEAILITDRLNRRHLRPSDSRGEERAFAALSRNMARAATHVPQRLVNTALDLCNAGSAGISVLRQQPQGDYLRWGALAGAFAAHTNVVTPRDFSPCGVALEVNAAQLFHCPGRFFTYLNGLGTMVIELLVVPIQADDRALGTMWVASHETDERQFDAGDLRVMVGLAEFAAVALQRTDAPAPRAHARRDDALTAVQHSPSATWWPPSGHMTAARWGRRLAATLGIH